MKKYTTCLFLLTLLTACSEQNDNGIGSGYLEHQVKGNIEAVTPTARITDSDTQATFQTGDPILIGGGDINDTYIYTYSGTGNLFRPASSNDLWSKLIAKGSSDVDMYAWYGKTPVDNTLPTEGSTITVETDQNTDKAYLSSLYMAAYTPTKGTSKNLNFTFGLLVSRIKLSINLNDKIIEESDIQDAVVKICAHSSAGVSIDASSKKYKLSTATTDPANQIIMRTISEAGSFHLQSTCLIPPQTLTEKHIITITLGKGKEYVCTLDKHLALESGQEAALSINITTEGTSVYDPVVAVIPETTTSSYSGNRLIVATSDNKINIYEKQADGSWGSPAAVYESQNSDTPFQTDINQGYHIRLVDIYKDYATFTTTKTTNPVSLKDDKLYFCKRDQTGKWYIANTLNDTPNYALVINKDFLVYGPDSGNSTAIPINAEGELQLDNKNVLAGVNGYKLSMGDNSVICSEKAAFKIELGADNKPKVTLITTFTSDRCSTDGKRVITQYTYNVIQIYNIETKQNEEIENPITAGVGRPVAIYDKYALAGFIKEKDDHTNKLVLYYFNDTKWIRIGDNTDNSFLHLLQKYAPNDAIKNLTYLTGNSLMMRGTRATISSEGVTFFVENIDKIVEQWLSDNSTTHSGN